MDCSIGGTRWLSNTGQQTLGEVYSPLGGWEVKENLDSHLIATNDVGGVSFGDNHAWTFQAPNGKVFHAGPAAEMHWIDLEGKGAVTSALRRGDDLDSMNGNAVMIDIGKILTLGGGVNYGRNTPAQKQAYVIDINGGEGQETVTRVGDLNKGRSLGNSVVLPSGEVVVLGGSTHAQLFSDNFSVMSAELWDPSTGQFRELSGVQMKVPRNYHSVALLMKDGRVWSGGGGLCGPRCASADANHPNSEIFTPPYLMDPNAKRPAIAEHTEQVPSGLSQTEVTLETNVSGASFVLMRLSSVTHSTNTDQRRIPLDIMNQVGNKYTLKLPTNQNILVPGAYWLFALADGVPSVGATVHVYPSNPGALFGLKHKFDISPNIAFSGSDYKTVQYPTGTTLDGVLTLCSRACDTDEVCKAFTAIKAGFFGQGKNAECHLKNTVPPENDDPRFVDQIIGGIKGDPITHLGEIIEVNPSEFSFERLVNEDLQGSDIPNSQLEYATTTTLEQAIGFCESDCAKIPNCVAVTVVIANYFGDGRGPICHPKNSIPDVVTSPNFVGRMISSKKVKATDKEETTSEVDNADLLPDIDLWGSDISNAARYFSKGMAMDEAVSACADLCKDLPSCVAFTVVAENFFQNNLGPRCFPKHTVPAQTLTPEFAGRLTSGIMKRPGAVDSFNLLASGIDLLGADLPSAARTFARGMALDKATEDCAKLCQELSLCLAFTVVADNFFQNNLGPKCHPKGSVPAKVSKPEYVGVITSGIKKHPDEVADFKMLPAIDLLGKDIPGAARHFAKSMRMDEATEECIKLCFGISACVAFTVVEDNFFGNGLGPKCYPKHSVPNQVPTPQYAGMLSSGIRQNLIGQSVE